MVLFGETMDASTISALGEWLQTAARLCLLTALLRVSEGESCMVVVFGAAHERQHNQCAWSAGVLQALLDLI
jgi:hypothetical protein